MDAAHSCANTAARGYFAAGIPICLLWCEFSRSCCLRSFILGGCSSATTIYLPVPGQGDINGLVDLAGSKDADVHKVEVMVMHGKGDHCRGYAIGVSKDEEAPKNVWLSPRAMKTIGLTEDDDSYRREDSIGPMRPMSVP